MSQFWSKSYNDRTLNDPKRKFRFIVEITGIGGENGSLWYAKSAQKPSFQIASTEHAYLNHKFYYPGGVTWQAVTITLVDPVQPNIGLTLASIVEQGGYHPPATSTDLGTMTKGKAVKSLGRVVVKQLDGDGASIEEWVLWNAFITELKWGDLEYGSDEILELSMTLQYDWAEMSTGEKGVPGIAKLPQSKAYALNGE